MVSGFTGSVLAQTALSQADTVVAASEHTSQHIDSLTRAEHEMLRQRRIPVKAGDSIVVSATLLDNTVYKSGLWKTLKKAIVPTFFLNGFTKNRRSAEGNRPTTDIPNVGMGVIILPDRLGKLKKAEQLETFVGLAAYDSAGAPLGTDVKYLSEAARKDWETLQVGYRAKQDGFVQIFGQQSQMQNLSVQTNQGNTWINVSKYSLKGNGGLGDPSSDGGAAEGNNGSSCTAWYWCTSYGCDFVGITCYDNYDDGYQHDRPADGGQMTSEDEKERKCDECMNLAQRVKTTRMNQAKYELATNLAFGCPAAAVAAGFSGRNFLLGLMRYLRQVRS